MERPRLTQKAAAEACGVSLSTIRRRRAAGEFPSASLDSGTWLIPVEDLLAAGLRVNAPAPPDEQGGEQGEHPAPNTVSGGHEQGAEQGAEQGEHLEVQQLRAELAEERQQRLLAEERARHMGQLVTARDEHLADMRRALLALTPGPPASGEQGEHPAPNTTSGGHEQEAEHPASGPTSTPERGDEQPARRRWWRRRR